MKTNDTAPNAAVSRSKIIDISQFFSKLCFIISYEQINYYYYRFLHHTIFNLACKESCPATKRVICGMRPKTFKNKCMINCLNRDKKKETKTQIIIAHKGKCVSGRGIKIDN